jgi:hypothetical protein
LHGQVMSTLSFRSQALVLCFQRFETAAHRFEDRCEFGFRVARNVLLAVPVVNDYGTLWRRFFFQHAERFDQLLRLRIAFAHEGADVVHDPFRIAADERILQLLYTFSVFAPSSRSGMKSNTRPLQDERLIEEIEAKQRNTVWPDTLENGRSVDAFLWKGSADAPLVQRIGAWIFGFTFMLLAVALIEVDRETTPDRKSIAFVILAVLFFGVGLKVFLNGFRRRKRNTESAE